MGKKNSLYANEIRLADIFQIIIDKKISIVLIMFISFLIGFGNNLLKKDQFEILLNIKPSKNAEFTNFLPIYNVTYDDFSLNSLLQKKKLQSGERSEFLTSRNEISLIMLDKFIDELLDYEEFISILPTNAVIAESIKELSFEKERQHLYSYTKLLTLKKPIKDKYIYDLSFIWHDHDEGVLILNTLLELVQANLEKRIFSNLDTLLEIKRRNNYDDDAVKIEYLKEQSVIAKELNIENNQVDSINLSQSNVSFNINTNNVAYYLRGFKIIDKEIKIIQNRQHIDIMNLEKDIARLKKTDIQWVYYNINYVSIKKLKTSNTLIVMIGIGLVISILYIYIIIVFKSKKLIKRFKLLIKVI